MRLFIAISIPKEIQKYLANIPVTGRKPKDYHLTLAFLGDADPDVIKKRLESVEFEPFKLKLSVMGCFPNKFSPRVLWVGVEPRQPVNELHGRIEKTLGLQDKKFHPHITLARNPKRFERQEIEPMEIKVDSFVLVSSTLTRQGPIYKVLGKYA